MFDAFSYVSRICRRFPGVPFVAVVWIIVCAVPAAAQQQDSGPVSIGVAAGIALPLHGDLDFTAAAWQADARLDVSPHFAVAAFFEEWRHTTEDVLTNQTVFGPDGRLGRIDRVTLRTGHRTRAVGVNFFAKAPLGRVTLHGGGGASSLVYTRDFAQTVQGCESSQPGVCTDVSSRFQNSGFSVQVQAGADVSLTSHLAATSRFRVLVPVQDIGGGHMSLTGGVRLFF